MFFYQAIFVSTLLILQINFLEFKIAPFVSNDQSDSWEYIYSGSEEPFISPLDPFQQVLHLLAQAGSGSFFITLIACGLYGCLLLFAIHVTSSLVQKERGTHNLWILPFLDPLLTFSIMNPGKDMFSFAIGLIYVATLLKVFEHLETKTFTLKHNALVFACFLIPIVAFYEWRYIFTLAFFLIGAIALVAYLLLPRSKYLKDKFCIGNAFCCLIPLIVMYEASILALKTAADFLPIVEERLDRETYSAHYGSYFIQPGSFSIMDFFGPSPILIYTNSQENLIVLITLVSRYVFYIYLVWRLLGRDRKSVV